MLYFSGIQPTGNIHLGNYLGALKNWLELQNTVNCLFCIVDLHAITINQDPNELHKNIISVAALYLACGIKKENIFVQSAVHEHSELAWILSCITPIGWMNRMTQFKDKTSKNKNNALVGLFTYPILMASDILLYKSTHVPVGEDQKQHVEITRDIAILFNKKVNKDFFPIPEFVSVKFGTRIMSLKDGLSKMSKSDESDYSRINLTDDNDLIIKKIMKAKTDSLPIPSSENELSQRPEAKNLITIMASLMKKDISDVLSIYKGQNFSIFKKDLAECINLELSNIREKYNQLISDKEYIINIINNGNNRAKDIASKNLNEIKQLLGLW